MPRRDEGDTRAAAAADIASRCPAWTKNQRCYRCSVEYQDVANMGRWECACHTGYLIRDATARDTRDARYGETLTVFRASVWSCCHLLVVRGQSNRFAQGCVRCDHSVTAQVSALDTVLDVPSRWLSYLEARPEACVASSTPRTVNIYRSESKLPREVRESAPLLSWDRVLTLQHEGEDVVRPWGEG